MQTRRSVLSLGPVDKIDMTKEIPIIDLTDLDKTDRQPEIMQVTSSARSLNAAINTVPTRFASLSVCDACLWLDQNT